jgi:hypothetical protein
MPAPSPATLPTLLSELLRLAVWDAIATEQTPGYMLRMNDWHVPISTELCAVCLAGSVMVQTLGVPRNERLRPEDFPEHRTALEDINDMRNGDVPDGLSGDERAAARLAFADVRTEFDDFCDGYDDEGHVNDECDFLADWSTYLDAADRLQAAGL